MPHCACPFEPEVFLSDFQVFEDVLAHFFHVLCFGVVPEGGDADVGLVFFVLHLCLHVFVLEVGDDAYVGVL